MKKNVFGKKTAALLAAVGLTAGLLAPFTTNISALTQDNGIKNGTRTAGDAEEKTGTLDYNDYKGMISSLSKISKNHYVKTTI